MTAESNLIEFIAQATATSVDGEHLVQMDYSDLIRLEGHHEPVQQASGRLQLGEWEPVAATCGEPDCCRPDHLAPAEEAKEQEDLQLVASHAVSLADLYRKGRKAGLLTAQSSGYGG
jgi:hypothetical protein